jgi:Protein of unknown function (DUF3306)
MAEERFLHRWARRKQEAARTTQAAPEPAAAAQPPVAAPPVPVEPPPVEAPLPPVESLSLESDFTPFLSAKVEETVKRAALRKLFSDPHFNVMDGLDVYIDDYSKPDPVPEGFLDKLADVYKTIEEKVAAAPPSDTTTQAAPEEPATNAEKDTDEREGPLPSANQPRSA